MATTIKLKNSVTTTAAPSSLVQGEAAVNITDKKLWVGNAASSPVQLLGAGATVSGTNVDYTGTLTGGTGVVNLGSGQFYKDASGNVGIGTASPSVKLDVSGAIKVPSVAFGANGGYFFNYGGNTGSRSWAIKNDVNTYGDFVIQTSTTQTSSTYVDRLNIDSSGNVGIGTSSPTRRLQVYQTTGDYQARFGYSDSYYYDFGRNSTSGYFNFYGNQSGAVGYIWGGVDGERMRIDSSGNLLVGTNTAGGGNGVTFYTGAESWWKKTVNGNAIAFFINSTNVGTISLSGSTTAYNTSSDYRLKEDIAPMKGALDRVSALKPVTYKWKIDGSAGEGFIAHELAEVVPDCVTGEKDAVDEEGKPVYQGIDTSFLVATLTAAIKEQQVFIEELKAKVAALEAA